MNDPHDDRVFGLLYVSEKRTSHANLKAHHDPVDTYLSCAVTCSAFYRAQAKRLVVLTNARERLLDRCKRLNIENRVDLQPHKFRLQVPHGIPFYEAHFKLDLLDAFGSGEYGPCITLVDLDTVALRPIRAASGLGLVNLGAEALGAAPEDILRRDISRLSKVGVSEVFWFGGEFLSGSADLFRLLSANIKKIWPQYLGDLKTFHHIGDEMLINAAVPKLLAEGVKIDDFAGSGDVTRWWSSRTVAPQVPFCQIAGSAVLHLPGDKPFLAAWRTVKSPQPEAFLREYKKYVQTRIALRRMASTFDKILSRKRRNWFVPSLV